MRGLDPEAFVRAAEIVDARQLLMVSGQGFDLELLKRVMRRYGRAAVRTLDKLLDS